MKWTEGYVTDVTYTRGYYAELSPSRVNASLFMSGLAPIPPGPCCELGFGHGISLVLNAAAHPDRAHFGTDFMPTHVVQARNLAQRAGVPVNLCDDSFDDYCNRDDLPQFAFIGLHGVWSWVSAANRSRIVAFLRRRLMPGGVVYISYNVSAGWIGAEPLRELIRLHATNAQPSSDPSPERLARAIEFARGLFALEPGAVAQVPALQRRLKSLGEQDPRYMVHEYLNADWYLGSFSETRAALAEARLDFAAPASLVDHMTAVHLSDAQQRALAEIQDQALRETTADFMRARSFRRDLWVRGAVSLSPSELAEQWMGLRLVAVAPVDDQPIRVAGSRAEATLSPAAARPILEALVEAGRPLEFKELVARRHVDEPGLPAFRHVVLMLLAAGRIDVARPEHDIHAAERSAREFNASALCQTADAGAHLVSPVTGVAAHFSRPELLLLRLAMESQATAAESVSAASRVLVAGGGTTPATEPLETVAAHVDRLIPLLRALKVI